MTGFDLSSLPAPADTPSTGTPSVGGALSTGAPPTEGFTFNPATPAAGGSPTEGLSDDAWLARLLNDEAPAGGAPAQFTAAGGLPDINQTATTSSSDSSELAEIKKVLDEMQKKGAQADETAKLDSQVQEKLDALKAKYGEADPELMGQFSDIFQSFRASLGTEFAEQSVRDTMELKAQLAALNSRLEQLSKAPQAGAAGVGVPDPQVYRNTIASIIPEYGAITSTAYFKQLLQTPVDPHNPDYTYNHKLGSMYANQDTQSIINLFSDIKVKLGSSSQHSPVVDSGPLSSQGHGNDNSLTTDKVHGILKQVISGEVSMSAEDLTRLRKIAGKMAMTR